MAIVFGAFAVLSLSSLAFLFRSRDDASLRPRGFRAQPPDSPDKGASRPVQTPDSPDYPEVDRVLPNSARSSSFAASSLSRRCFGRFFPARLM